MSVTTITQNACIDLHQTGSVDAGSDHLQLIKFWLSCAPGRGSAAGRKFLAPDSRAIVTSKRAVFASLRALFSFILLLPGIFIFIFTLGNHDPEGGLKVRKKLQKVRYV